MTKPLPSPATSNGAIVASPTEWPGSRRTATSVATSPAVTTASPAVTIGRPSRMTARPPNAEPAAMPRAKGVTASPASRALYPSPLCTYSVKIKKIAVKPAKYTRPIATPSA